MREGFYGLPLLCLGSLLFVSGSIGMASGQSGEETPGSGASNTSTGSGVIFYVVEVDGNQYRIRFQISNASIQEMTIDKETKSLLVILGSGHQKGELQLELGRDIIDAKDQNDADVEYNVFIDGSRFNSAEVSKNEESRFLTIPFGNDAREITITGTQVVPEFPYYLLVLVPALGVPILLRRTKLFTL